MTIFLTKISDGLSEISNLSNQNKDVVITFFSKQLFRYLQNAILAGEYCQDNTVQILESITSQINNTESQILQLETGILPSNSKWSINDFSLLKKHLDLQKEHLKLFSKLTSEFAENVNLFADGQDGKVTDTKRLELFLTRKEISSMMKSRTDASAVSEDIDVTQHYMESLFEINIWLAYIDEHLECSDGTKKNLNIILEYLEDQTQNNNVSEIFKLLIDKAKYLLFKIEYRTTRKQDQIAALSDTNAYKEFLASTIRHFSEKKNKEIEELEKTIEDLKNGRIETFSLQPFHELNRYYHRCDTYTKQRRIEKVDKLYKIIEEKKAQIKDPFDKIAINSVRGLLYNTSVSLKIEIEKDQDFSTVTKQLTEYLTGKKTAKQIPFIQDLYAKITEHSATESIPDYYCQKVFLEFLESFLKFLKKDPTRIITNEIAIKEETKLLIRISDVVTYLEETFSKALDNLKSTYRRVKTYDIKPVYLLKRECIRSHKWENEIGYGNLFLDTSYVLPNDFAKINKQIESFESFLNAQIDPLKNTFEVTISRANIKSEIAGFEKKVKENEIKIVQIVAMFVSIATFVLINVKIFDGKNPLQSFAIMLGLAGSFFLFNLFFHLVIVIQHRGWKSTLLFILKSILLIATPLAFALFSYWILDGQQAKQQQLIPTQNDSFSSARSLPRTDTVSRTNDTITIGRSSD